MVRYTFTETGKAHIVTEYDPDEQTAETACGLSLIHVGTRPLDTEKETVSGPRLGERCENCERARGWSN